MTEEKNSNKMFYSIGELAKMFNVNTSLIRYWDKEFDIIKPQKNKKGNRLFTQKDVDNFHLIYHLVKERGMTLSGAKNKIKEKVDGIESDFQIVKKLKEIKSLLNDINNEL